MRVLIGPFNRVDGAVGRGLAGLDARCFDRAGADVDFEPATEPLEALWARLPAGWRPDCLIWWSPEYSLLPEGIDRCPVPTIAVLGDWNLGCWTTAPLLEAFDWVVTDRAGVRALGPQLEAPVDAWRAFSFDPALHRRVPGMARDIDVLFVGNTYAPVQAERAPWLARLARLAPRHQVVLASGVYGEGYAALLNRARLVWNRSIRGELNMRAYEAPACGALLLMESENLEVREVFADGESCALYGADDLERIIGAWLGSPARLAAAADAGWRRVQGETYAHHLSDLVDRARGLRRTPRAFRRLPGWRRRFWLALHALASADSARITAALTHLARAAECGGDPVALAATSGAATAMGATLAAPEAQQAWLDAARGLLATAVQADPDDLVSAMNLAWVERASRRGAEAAAHWERAHQRLDAAAPFPLDRIPVPFGFDRLRVAWERGSIAADLASRAEAFRPLLRARAAAELAALSTGEAATRWWQASVDAAPHVSDNVRGLARALEAAGPARIAGAAAAWSDVVAADPLDWEAREGAVRTAVAAGQQARAAALVDDARCLARAIGEAPGAVGSPAAGRSPDPALPVGVTS